MQRDLVADNLPVRVLKSSDPAAHFPDLFLRIILPGHDQSRELHMTVLHGSFYKVHDHPPAAAQHLLVVPVCKALQVNVHCVNIRQYLLKYPDLRGPVRNERVLQAFFMHELRGIAYEFIADQRLIVRERDSDIALSHASLGHFGQFLRRHGLRETHFLKGFVRPGNLIVLAERAAQIAPEAPDRQNITSREKPRQRLLLYRIERDRRNPAVIQGFNRPVFAGPRAAKTGLSVSDLAVTEAHITSSHMHQASGKSIIVS